MHPAPEWGHMAQMNKQVSHHLSQMLSGTCAFLHSAFDLCGGEA